ncbi:hypothetical protein pEaSNUABM37_00351 [Erwinia phage pEa_SNUABM_37]|nr:hypothetical protein pEaSNUABM37_00351 [Erwinia phage pEa_SNUABM_37]QXO10819.1 hypothetical protein pEaSNUABM48_00351 [Erwinia phage pEa_SNUABM_48]
MSDYNFFAADGLDGCGKSTLLDKINAAFKERGHPVAWVDEPGHYGEHEHLRRIMTDSSVNVDPSDKNMIRTLLMAADRVLSAAGIRKAIAKGNAVLSSRSFMSSVVYQGIVGGQLDLVTKIHQEAGLIFPSIIFVLRVSGETSVRRMTHRGPMDDIEKDVADRANQYAAAYDYAESFVRHISGGKTKVIYLDGEASPDDIFAHAMAHIKEHMGWN